MLHVVCVRHGEAFGVEYVERLHDMVRRNLPDGFAGRFVCFTDRPADLSHLQGIDVATLAGPHPGWWAKLELFMPGTFSPGDRVWYFDLDTVITGPLEKIFEYPGAFGILEDVYRPGGFQSSVMSWIAETPLVTSIWEEWNHLGCPLPHGGDQEVLERFWHEWLPAKLGGRPWPPDFLQKHFPGAFRSYKVECQYEIPKGTSVVFFHGLPRPHQVITGWVPHVWKVGGGTSAEFVLEGTVPQEKVLANVRDAIAKDWPIIPKGEAVDRLAIICGGGPSLKDLAFLVANLQNAGAAVFSVNQVDGFLRDLGIRPNFHVMVDARPELEAWVNEGGIKLYASMCDPAVLERGAAAGDLNVWHAQTDGIKEIFGPNEAILIGGGTTVGLRAMVLAYVMGFRRIACFGFDGSYADGQHHAYPQALNDGENVLDVICGGKTFKAAPWMVQQAQDFKDLVDQLENGMDCEIQIWGDGLLPTMFAGRQQNAATQRARQLNAWLGDQKSVQGVEVGVFAGDLSSRLLRRPGLVLYMVDNWKVADPDSPYADVGAGDFHAKLTQEQQDAYLEKTRMMTRFAVDRACILRMDSVRAAGLFEDGSLDFVFIDADHSYEGCSADIKAWLPKVRAGGFISGHDYDNPAFPAWGVKRAVDETFGSRVELGENFTWRVAIPAAQSQQRDIA